MTCWFNIVLLCFFTTLVAPSVKSRRPNEKRRLHEINNKVWNTISTSPMSDDENFYEFINRVTHGKMFNLSVEANKILQVIQLRASFLLFVHPPVIFYMVFIGICKK